MKSEYGTKLERLEAKMAGVGQSPTNIDRLIEQGVGNLFRIADVYADGSPAQKKLVIGSMFPEKMTFDGFLLRTG